MRELQLEALRSVLADLEGELGEYDAFHDTTQLEGIKVTIHYDVGFPPFRGGFGLVV